MTVYYKFNRSNVGFTLVELMITIAVMAIVATLAAPSMQNQIQQMKIKKAAAVFESTLREAQVQAIITQKSTKVILTNTSTDKNLKVFNVGEASATATYQLDKDVTITPSITSPTPLSAVSFTPDRKSYQGETIGTTRMGQDSDGNAAVTGFYICLGAGTNRYLVQIDASNSLKSQVNGSCS